MRFCAICLVVLASCGQSTPTLDVFEEDQVSLDHAPTEVTELFAGQVTLSLNPEARTVSLKRGGQELLRLVALTLGRVDALDDALSYDPYFLYEGTDTTGAYAPPEGLRWLAPSGIEASGDDHAMNATLVYPEGLKARLHIEVSGPGRFRLSWIPEGSSIAYMRLGLGVDRTEGFYGLGGFFDEANHRGRVRAMQIEPDLELESHYNEAHVRVPLLLGTTGWGIFLQSYLPAAFDCAQRADDLVEVTVGTGEFSQDGLVFYLMAEERPIDLTRHYYEVTGFPALPARWAIGPLLWRDEVEGQAQVEADLEMARKLDLATSGYWIDRPYATDVNTFDFDPARFPDPKAMVAKAHDLGFRLALWHAPYVGEKGTATAELNKFAQDNGFYPPRCGPLLNHWGRPVDFTNPAAFSWWQTLLGRYTGLGFEGFKVDYGEDVVIGILGQRNPWRFYDGSDERTMHHAYQNFLHRAYFETLPEEGGFILARNSAYGDQTHVTVIWPGDADSSFARHREVETGLDGSTYVAVGGLPATVVYGLSLGPSGFPFFGADTGGYRHAGPPDKELFVRWFEQTALSTCMQVGNNASSMPWDFVFNGKPLYDQETLDLYRKYARLHLRLFPYIWTYARALLKDGRPIQRPIGLAYPEMGVHPSDEYLLGDHLLVAPVMTRGATGRKVLFPPGKWVSWHDGKSYEGARDVEAPLGILPLFIKAGALIPLLRPTIDTMAPAKGDWDSYANDPGVLYVRAVPGGATDLVLFDGAVVGQTEATLRWKDGAEFRKGAVFEVIGWDHKPAKVLDGAEPILEVGGVDALEAAPTGWYYDPAKTLWVKVRSGERTIVIQ